MSRFNRPLFHAVASVVATLGMSQSTNADSVTETEPNDTFATATQTVGQNDLEFVGSLTPGDIDVFSVLVIPNPSHQPVAAVTTFWSEGLPRVNSDKWLNMRIHGPIAFGQASIAVNQVYFTFSMTANSPEVWYFELFSTTPNMSGIEVPPPRSTVSGDYRINVRGIDDSLVNGTAVPEPRTSVLCLGLVVCGILFRRQASTARTMR